MNALTKTFENSDIRLAEINGEVWWNLKDVCASLAMGKGSEKQMKKRHGANYFQLVKFPNHLDGKKYRMLAVNQKGLLRIIWRSNKPKAEIFSDWCAEVISEILQTGRYDVREHEEQIRTLQERLQTVSAERDESRLLLEDTQNSLARIQQQKTQAEANFDKVADRHAWTIIMGIRGIEGGSFDKRSPRYKRMCRLVGRLTSLRTVSWTRGKPYFVSDAAIQDSMPVIQGWRL